MKEFFGKIKYELLIFAGLCTNLLLLFSRTEIFNDILYPLYLVDFKAGFISRTLIGSIIGLFSAHPTKLFTAVFQLCAILFGYMLLSVYLARILRRTEDKMLPAVSAIIAFFIVFPFSVRSFVNLFELIDIYWFITAVLIMFCAESKKLKYFIPLLAISGLLVHYGFLMAFMPLIYIVCLDIALSGDKKQGRLFFAFMVVITVGASAYFVLNARGIAITYPELVAYLKEKAGDKLTALGMYIGKTFTSADEFNKAYQFFDIDEEKAGIFLPLYYLIGNIKVTLAQEKPLKLLVDFLLITPVSVFFIRLWRVALKNAQTKLHRFMYFLCIIAPLVPLFTLLMSTDTEKWCSLALITQFMLLFRFISAGNPAVMKYIGDFAERVRAHRMLSLVCFGAYLSFMVVW